MRLVRLLPERWQKFINEALKFGIVGGINTVINYAVFNILALTIFLGGQLKATVVATIVATITSYLMNRHWTYRDRPKSACGARQACSSFQRHRVGDRARRAGRGQVRLRHHRPAGTQRRQDPRHRARHPVPLLVVPDVRLP